MANIIRSLRKGWRVNGMRRELSRLSDAQLRDIGINRGQIDDLARYCHGVGPRPNAV